jgi:hypothetical protein
MHLHSHLLINSIKWNSLWKISSSIGLCKGDPLSLYKFGEIKGNIRGIKVVRSLPTISHLLFADIFFFATKSNEVVAIKSCLDTYARWSDQLINSNKSSIFNKITKPLATQSAQWARLKEFLENENSPKIGLEMHLHLLHSISFSQLGQWSICSLPSFQPLLKIMNTYDRFGIYA